MLVDDFLSHLLAYYLIVLFICSKVYPRALEDQTNSKHILYYLINIKQFLSNEMFLNYIYNMFYFKVFQL